VLSGVLPYAAVLGFAIVEGEIAYIGAAALVADGQLHPLGVLLAGTLGASIGDQTYFYVFRGRLPRWMARYPALQQKAEPLVSRVRRHARLMVMLIRFAPGLRIALTAACAWAEVPPRTFSALNLLSAFAWATLLLLLVAWAGPTFLSRFGLGGWRGALLAGVLIFGVFKILGLYERRALDGAESGIGDGRNR
jgi:membrane protein DedA with SNARE-associated domain